MHIIVGLAVITLGAITVPPEPVETNVAPPGSIIVPPPRGTVSNTGPAARPLGPVVPQLVVNLADGSKLIGTTTLKALSLRSEALGKLTVPLERIASVKFSKDRESVTVTLHNGDRLQAGLTDTTLALTTIFGPVTVPLAHVNELSVTLRGGPTPQGLLLWNSLDSPAEVETSRCGPGGVYKGGAFDEGKFGRALVVRHDQQRLVTFPADGVNPNAGCLEFWAKLTGLPPQLEWNQNPTLVRIVAGDQQYFLHLNGNDGASRGGLCAAVGPIGGAGTGQFGDWTYERVLGAGKVADWHHYALVWDKAGIDGIGDGQQRVAIFLDGELHASEAGDAEAAPTSFKDGHIELLFIQRLRQGTYAFDNLKVWDHAKTNFDNRHNE